MFPKLSPIHKANLQAAFFASLFGSLFGLFVYVTLTVFLRGRF